VHRERISKRNPQTVGDDFGRVGVAFDQYREFVAADAG